MSDEVVFADEPEPFLARRLCGRNGRWEKQLACAICETTLVRVFGEPMREPKGCRGSMARVLFECAAGHVFTVSFNDVGGEVWVGCHHVWNNVLEDWGGPLDEEQAELEGER